MSVLDLEALRRATLAREPYAHVIVPGFLRPEALAGTLADFPPIARPGSFPVSGLAYGPGFAALMAALETPAIEAAFAEKFDVDLAGRARLVTVRGRCRARDGRIHTDSADKLITALIYLNASWEGTGGRLRVLRSANDLEDYAAEVPPAAGTLLAFRPGARSFHGHHPFVGERRVVQLNWVTSARVARREGARHRLSAWVKGALSAGWP